MKVEIWSDIMCPFCYIGKRKFEAALAEFPGREDIEIVWRSFQLDPDMPSMPGKSVMEYLAERKGQSLDWSRNAHAQVTAMAAKVGLTYNFDKAIVANSWDAHRLIQMAKQQRPSLGDAAEEMLFRAYFTEGKDMSDPETLVQLGVGIGMDAAAVREMLDSDQFAAEVKADVQLAQQFGVRGVPFFAFDRKYAVSGAQEPAAFLQALQQSHAAWRGKDPQAGG
jgi:predicted DsbA family dithiol-disulfide isomerase